jgi:hypothetical protein
MGDLLLPTGQLVACDPFVQPETKPFLITYPSGRFPVFLIIAESSRGDQRVAFAVVNFSSEPAIRWEILTTVPKDVSKLGPDEILGYGVDSGTGSFMDVAAARILMEKMNREKAYFDTLMAEMEKTYRHTWSWVNASLGDTNLLAFSSGYGDGVYASYAGYTATNQVVKVITDFGVLGSGDDDTDEQEKATDSEAPSGFWKLLRRKK